MTPRPLVVCSKSTWAPAIRREHALARVSAARGHAVTFVERPQDVRALRDPGARRGWAAAVAGRGRRVADGVAIVPTAVLAPGHRARVARALESRSLAARLRALGTEDASVVTTVPWRWPGAMAAPARRRVFDCADDWSDLLPDRRAAMRELYRRVGAEADAVVVVREELADLFGGREVHVVGNGVAKELLGAAEAGAPRAGTMVYTGTFTERFDADLVSDTLDRLPAWRIELYGQCQYPGAGERPAGDLRRLLLRHPGRAVWHGVAERTALPRVLDGGAVLVLPHRRNTDFGGRRGWGGDVMKLYDYAARGRPIVSTRWDDSLAAAGPPGLRLVDRDPDAFASALRAAADDPDGGGAAARRAWAAGRSWESRWEDWACHVFAD